MFERLHKEIVQIKNDLHASIRQKAYLMQALHDASIQKDETEQQRESTQQKIDDLWQSALLELYAVLTVEKFIRGGYQLPKRPAGPIDSP